jgi:hypothetical protein
VRLELQRLASAGVELQGTVPSVLFEEEAAGPRAWVVGTGDRVQMHGSAGLLPRHVVIITVPYPDGVCIRVLCLHPDRGVVHLRRDLDLGDVDDDDDDDNDTDRDDEPSGANATMSAPLGGLVDYGRLQCLFDGYVLDVSAQLERPSEVVRLPSHEPSLLAKGEQLAFYSGASVRPIGTVVSSVGGPGGSGHAIPALVTDTGEAPGDPGSLVLRSRGGVHRLEPSARDLRRGLLVGRSRRCQLGRGFDENDGLSRLHALVMLVDDGVYAFDLASRYGLRDVARPNRLVPTARLDDGVGCLVYGAGHLLFER